MLKSGIMASGLKIRRAIRRGFAMLGLMLAVTMPAFAMRHLTVSQLDKMLAADVARHRSDGDMMREFGSFDLTERLTDATRNRMSTDFHLGPQTTLALQLKADESALLDPPASELPSAPPPDAAAAKKILGAATSYVTRTLSHLPDFLATRTTYTFNDTAQILKVNEWPIHAGLHLIGQTSREITFRDDHEVAAPAAQTLKASAPAQPHPFERGLQAYGEFGTLLGLVFVDTAKGTLAFHHWEKTAGGAVAVFHYRVPKAESHYTVNYCCLFDGIRTSTRGGGRRGGGVTNTVQSSASTLFHKVPAYHGSLFIDPLNGVVLRITLEAELGDGPVSRAATVIEYGPVAIGDRKFICPVRSMNLYVGPFEPGPQASELPGTATPALEPTGTLYVNETSFTNYHRLGSEIRILPAAEVAPTANR